MRPARLGTPGFGALEGLGFGSGAEDMAGSPPSGDSHRRQGWSAPRVPSAQLSREKELGMGWEGIPGEVAPIPGDVTASLKVSPHYWGCHRIPERVTAFLKVSPRP